MIGAAANLSVAGFDAPGSGVLYPQVTNLVSSLAGSGYGGTDINYRLNGDQVSEAGTTLGQAYTIASPYPSNTLVQTVSNFLNNHAVGSAPAGWTKPVYQYAYQNLENPGAYTPGITGTNIAGPLAAATVGPYGSPVLKLIVAVVQGVAQIIDPPSGTEFTLIGDANSPNIASVTLPFIAGVANYDVAEDIGGTFSAFQTIAPGVADTLPADVEGIEIAPVDSFGNAATIASGFLFTMTFASTGTFTGTLTTTGASGAEGLPITSTTTLDVLPNAAATALGITAPTDASYPDTTQLAVQVEALPTNGTVTLSDGVTAVTANEVLTVAQLTGLEFAPTANDVDTSSVFSYSVTDPDLSTAEGTASVNVVCYARGTRILTDHGEVAVEHLSIGDRLITRKGEARALRWIGRRAYAGRFAAANPDVLPVRISANAIEPGVPKRDLWVSPRHAMYLDNILIPAASLVNGITIQRVADIDEVTYYHLELCTHDIIIAEGALSESYLDLDNRRIFHNAHEYAALYGENRRGSLCGYAPRHEQGEAVEAVWSRLAARAALPGFVSPRAQDIALSATGVYHARVPAGVTELILRSPMSYHPNDRRPLGALITRVAVDGVDLDLAGPLLMRGFHECERHGSHAVRWTNGAGVIRLPACDTDRRVEIDVASLSSLRVAS
jgi:hypothetical protein